MMNYSSESGRSMIEMLGVLSVIGVLSIGAVSGISFGFKMFKTNETVTMVEDIAQNVSDLYQWDRSLPESGDEAAKMKNRICNNAVWETDCLSGKSNATYRHPYGGDLVISPDSVDNFKITLENLPAEVCKQLVTSDWVNVHKTTDSDDDLNPSCDGTTFTVYSK